jgi:hypothetical protein
MNIHAWKEHKTDFCEKILIIIILNFAARHTLFIVDKV